MRKAPLKKFQKNTKKCLTSLLSLFILSKNNGPDKSRLFYFPCFLKRYTFTLLVKDEKEDVSHLTGYR